MLGKQEATVGFALPGYGLRRGSSLERSQLVHFLSRTYAETAGTQAFDHLAQTVDRHLSPNTPIWWVYAEALPHPPIAGLWLGSAIDQQRGDRHSYVLMLYVSPAHRRQGIATALLKVAQVWAQQQGDRQLGLQVLGDNSAAIALYTKLGYRTHSLWLTKPLEP